MRSPAGKERSGFPVSVQRPCSAQSSSSMLLGMAFVPVSMAASLASSSNGLPPCCHAYQSAYCLVCFAANRSADHSLRCPICVVVILFAREYAHGRVSCLNCGLLRSRVVEPVDMPRTASLGSPRRCLTSVPLRVASLVLLGLLAVPVGCKNSPVPESHDFALPNSLARLKIRRDTDSTWHLLPPLFVVAEQ